MPSQTQDPIAIDQTGGDNPAGLAPTDVQVLMAGGDPGHLKFLYPYEGTVFPRGLLAPLLMWDGGPSDVAYVHLHAQSFDYKGVLKVASDPMTMAPQLALPEDVWAKAGQKTNGRDDSFALELTVRSNGMVAGPITLHFVIAQATIKGSIYYDSYASQLPGAAIGGNVLRIPPGGMAELFMSMQCNGCHSVSAEGSTMLSQIAQLGGEAYALTAGGPTNPTGTSAGPRAAFAALYPDGSKYLSTSTAVPLGHSTMAQGPGSTPESVLYDTATGQAVPDTGIPTGALMPMFSPDGTRLVFTDVAINNGDGLAVMDYDVKANRATGYRVLVTDDADTRPGWPFFLPDGKGVIFTRTASADYSGDGAFIGAGAFGALAGPFAPLTMAQVPGPYSELHIADVATGKVTLLAKAMGYTSPDAAASGETYLPFPEDLRQAYFPTVSPIAAGGYLWMVFDSIRNYGNRGLQRQLWGSAVDIHADGNYALDPSHPAFYVPGQEYGAGNHRAFAALDPCKKDGDKCTSGIDCCGGSCFLPAAASEFGEGTCAPQQNMCAKRDERCTSDSDCCPPEPGKDPDFCIAGFCAFIPLN